MRLQGTITALITPFKENEIDEKGLISNISYQIEQGVEGLLVLGSTGEAATLSAEEQRRLIAITVQTACKRVPVWVGTGSNCTRQTIEKTRWAQDLGADIALVVTPYYNRPTQEGLYRHFEAITQSVQMPLVLYHVPGRCGCHIEASTLLRLAALPHVVGLKEASGNIQYICEIQHALQEKYPHFCLLSGDDALTLPMMALGASGVVSVVSNLVPAQVSSLVNYALKGDFKRAQKIHHSLMPLFKAAFIESNPIPIKAAMSLCHLPAGECRLPLTPLSPDHREFLERLLLQMQLLRA